MLRDAIVSTLDFNSRTHVECDYLIDLNRVRAYNFNSRTHVECDVWQRNFSNVQKISTHALTWSATTAPIRKSQHFLISTHALTWSATPATTDAAAASTISTHALTWSATDNRKLRMPFQRFQLTHSRGVRRSAIGQPAIGLEFQLTHSRGVRRVSPYAPDGASQFQLTHSRGVRLTTLAWML